MTVSRAAIKIAMVVALAAIVCMTVLARRVDAPTASMVTGTQNVPGAIRYLPLGDSYTIGESVPENERWPNQLVTKLATSNRVLRIVDNPAVTGYTSQDVIDHELPLVPTLNPDFVTILIGVNDYVQGVTPVMFQKNLHYIIDAVQKGIPQPGNIVLVSIPDFAKTPSGSRYGDPNKATAGIAEFNAIITKVGASRNLPVADVFTISQKVVSDPSLTANDGLHPSSKQYALWTDVIYKTVQASGLLR